MDPIKVIRSKTVVMSSTNIDTDQIIPARFLTTTTREGLGAALFADLRNGSDGSPRPDFVLNRAESRGCRILVAGRNIGCGSSREHAPWALLDYGFQAVISNEIADIFRSNSLKNGLLPIVVDDATHQWLLDNPGAALEIDLPASVLRLPDGREITFPVEPFARFCLMNGVDELGYLLGQADAIAAYESRHA